MKPLALALSDHRPVQPGQSRGNKWSRGNHTVLGHSRLCRANPVQDATGRSLPGPEQKPHHVVDEVNVCNSVAGPDRASIRAAKALVGSRD